MGGVDVIDQYNAADEFYHRVRNYFWRYVFEAKLFQSLTKSWVVFKYWARLIDLNNFPVGEEDVTKMKRDGYSYRGMVGEVVLRAKFRATVGTRRALEPLIWLKAISLYLPNQYREVRPIKKEAPENDHDVPAETVHHAGSISAAGGWTMLWDANAVGRRKRW